MFMKQMSGGWARNRIGNSLVLLFSRLVDLAQWLS